MAINAGIIKKDINLPGAPEVKATTAPVKAAVRPGSIEDRMQKERASQEEDWARGIAQGEQRFATGKLGRLEEDQRMKDILARRQAQAEGFTPQEMATARAGMISNLAGQQQAAMRQLRGIQGASGVTGGAAGAQAADIMRGGQQAMLGAEQNLQMQNLMARRQGLSDYETSLTGTRKYDIGQANKELMAQYQTGLAQQMLGVAGRGGIRAEDIARQQAAVSSRDDGGVSVFCTHFKDKGMLPVDVWKADCAFGSAAPKELIVGYYAWAFPLLDRIANGGFVAKMIEAIMWPLVNAYAHEIAHVMGVRPKGSFFGKIIRNTLEPLTYIYGKYKLMRVVINKA